jgi:hypothetical protein
MIYNLLNNLRNDNHVILYRLDGKKRVSQFRVLLTFCIMVIHLFLPSILMPATSRHLVDEHRQRIKSKEATTLVDGLGSAKKAYGRHPHDDILTYSNSVDLCRMANTKVLAALYD